MIRNRAKGSAHRRPSRWAPLAMEKSIGSFGPAKLQSLMATKGETSGYQSTDAAINRNAWRGPAWWRASYRLGKYLKPKGSNRADDDQQDSENHDVSRPGHSGVAKSRETTEMRKLNLKVRLTGSVDSPFSPELQSIPPPYIRGPFAQWRRSLAAQVLLREPSGHVSE